MSDTNSADKHRFLKSKIQIGNVKGPISYKLGQTVFHHDDIPEPKRLRRNEIKAWTKSRTLSVDRDSWSKSTHRNMPAIERRQAENYAKDRSSAYQYNYRAETLDSLRQIEPIDQPTKFHISTQLETRALEIREAKDADRVQKGNFNRTGEMPVHPSLQDAQPWNVSTYFERTEKDKRLAAVTAKAQERANDKNHKLLQRREYVSPIQTTMNLTKKVREMKSHGAFNADEAMNRKGHDPVDRKSLINRYALEKINRVTESKHTGVWERSRIDGRYMWSDTASEIIESKGDQTKTTNLDAYNFQGPNFSNSRLVQNKSRASTANTSVSDAPFIL